MVGWKKSQALFRKWLCIFRGNKCGIEESRYTHRRLVHVSLSYSLATVETPQDRKIGSGMTACSKLRLPTSFQFVWTSFDLVEVIKLNFSVVKGDTENIEIKYASLETLISYLFCSTGSLDLHNKYGFCINLLKHLNRCAASTNSATEILMTAK